jgi:hypothetical protein
VGLDFALREPRDQGGPLGTDSPSKLEGRELAVPDPVAHLPLGQPEKFGDRGGPVRSRPAWSVVVSLTGIAAPSIQELLPALPWAGQELSKTTEDGLARARARTALETHAGLGIIAQLFRRL